MKTFVVCLTLCLICAVKLSMGNVAGFHSFEEYLQHVTSEALRSDNVDYSDDDDTAPGASTSTSNELLSYFRTIPRDHWSCCMLGLLAGSKGFQCQPQYYSSSAELSRRNVNRAQTAHQPGVHGGHQELTGPHWGYSISRSFHRCVGGQETRGVAAADDRDNAQEFHKCCYAAAEERRQLRRARRYRRRHPTTSRRQ